MVGTWSTAFFWRYRGDATVSRGLLTYKRVSCGYSKIHSYSYSAGSRVLQCKPTTAKDKTDTASAWAYSSPPFPRPEIDCVIFGINVRVDILIKCTVHTRIVSKGVN